MDVSQFTRVPREISRAFEQFRREGSVGGESRSSLPEDQVALSQWTEAIQVRQFDNHPQFDADPRLGHVSLTFEGKQELGQSHWESYRAEVSEGEVLIHAASGESTQEFNLVTEFQGRPSVARAGVDLNELFVHAYQLAPGARPLTEEFKMLSRSYLPD